MRGEERVEEEQRRSKELMQRVERERQLEVENWQCLADFLNVNVIDYKYKCQCHSGGELFNTAAGRREGRQGSRR